MWRGVWVLGLVACAPMDRRPPFASAWFTGAAGVIQGAKVHDASGELEAGWASEAIAVPSGTPLAGYAERDGAPHSGAEGPIAARAFALRVGFVTAVILNADLLAIDDRTAAAVRAEVPAPVYFTATHTHSGPGGYVPGLLYRIAFGEYDPRAAEAVASALVKAARGALERLSAARVGSAEIAVPGLCANRVERDGAVDEVLFALVLIKPDDHAALWSYGCHAVTRGAGSMKLSADFPGDVAARLAGGTIAYLAGGVGSANPRRPDISAPLAAALSRAIATARAGAVSSTRLAHAQVTLRFPPIRYRLTDDLMALPIAAQAVLQPGPLRIGVLGAGDAELLFLPAEIGGQLSRDLRARAGAGRRRLAILSFNGDYAGYLVPRRLHDLPSGRAAELHGYETRTMSFLGAWGGDALLNLASRLLLRVREGREAGG